MAFLEERVPWDIDNNVPVYTKDFIKLYSIDGHLCLCHVTPTQCYGCEALDCKFHKKWIQSDYEKPDGGETDIAFGHPSEPPTPRERFHRIIGHPVSAEQWQQIKEFVRDNPVT